MKILTGHWLLGQDFLDRMEDSAQGFVVDQPAYTAFIERRSRSREDGDTDLFVRAGSTAHILIVGVLSSEPDFFFDMFGGGSAVYGDIVAAVRAAEDDETITDIVLEIDSPGGEVAGFLRTAQVIADVQKPVEAQVTNMAASAAFGLAAQANTIIVENTMAMVGSVGVVATMFVSDARVTITSTEGPDKRPDVTTDEGVAAVKRELDAIHAEFAGIIASGRGVSVAEVNADFGRGALVIANSALQSGMIDGIGSASRARESNESSTNASAEGNAMDLAELKAKHPDLFKAVRDEGIAAGIDKERDRVTAHVKAGAAMGAGEIACRNIIDGTEFGSQTAQAEYLVAGRNLSEITARHDDEQHLNGLSNAKTKTGGDDAKPDEEARVKDVFAQVEANLDINTVEA
jgi:ClpP class serine protease